MPGPLTDLYVTPEHPAKPIPFHWMVFAIIVLLAFFAWTRTMPAPPQQLSISPPPIASGSLATPVPYPTYPRELVALAVVQLTAAAPTVTPTRAPAALPAAVNLVCTRETPKGTVCTMPTETPPPPTAIPDCPVYPGTECVATGVWIAAMPLPPPTTS